MNSAAKPLRDPIARPEPVRAAPPPAAAPAARTNGAAIVIWIGMAITVLDGTIANVGLPAMGRDLHVDASAAIAIVNAFQLAMATSLLLAAALGARLGAARVFQAGLILFTLASVGCAFAPTFVLLVLARIAQGIGAAGVLAIAPALFRAICPSKKLGRAFAISSMVVAVSAALGPAIGGIILTEATWPWLFAVVVPLGLGAAYASFRVLPQARARANGLFDVVSTVATIVSLGAIVAGIMSISRGVPAPAIAAEFGLGIAAGVVFVRRCTGRANAVVDVDLFRIPLFSCSALTSAATYTAQGLAYVALPFFFQSALGMSPLEAGLLFTAWPAGIVLASAFVTKLLTRLSSGNLATIGLAILACGLTSYALIPGRPSILDILVRGAICGIGFGFFQAPNNAEMMTTAPADRATSASGFIAVVRVLGQTLGAGLAAVVFAAFASRVIDAATSALWCAVAAASLATFLSLLRLVGRRRSADAASQPVPHRTVVLVKA